MRSMSAQGPPRETGITMGAPTQEVLTQESARESGEATEVLRQGSASTLGLE